MNMYYITVKSMYLIFKESNLQFIVKVQVHLLRALHYPYLPFCYHDGRVRAMKFLISFQETTVSSSY